MALKFNIASDGMIPTSEKRRLGKTSVQLSFCPQKKSHMIWRGIETEPPQWEAGDRTPET